jgi:hypothetical protein
MIMTRLNQIASLAMVLAITFGARAADDKPLGTGKFQKDLVIDVMELKPTSDGFLKVSFRIRNPSQERLTCSINAFTFPNSMYYIEEGGKFKFTVIKDDKGEFLWGRVNKDITLGPDETFETWAKFGQPHKGIKHITLYFKDSDPIEDIPVPTSSKGGVAESKPAAGKALGTGKLQNGLVIDVLELKRTSDGFLRVSFQIRNPSTDTIKHAINGFTFPNSMYYVEEGGKFKFTVIKDDKGEFIWGRVNKDVKLGSGETLESWAKFGQPHKGIKHITFYFKDAEPIEDVPVPKAGD